VISFADRCTQFGVDVIRMIRGLDGAKGIDVPIRQFIKSATSIGANVAEARSAQSRADFISKFEIALKEARETNHWLRVLEATIENKNAAMQKLINECWQITAILVASAKTAKRNGGIVEARLQNGRAESRDQN
jgi:four helix bundle protein